MAYELQNNDIIEIEELEGRWYACSESIVEEDFDLEDFKTIAHATYRWLEKFRNDNVIPKEIVSLLMSIEYFVSTAPYGISAESNAALHVAEAFCDIKHCFSIGGLFDNNTFLSVQGEGGFCYIEPNTFDMTQLIETEVQEND